MTALRDEQMMAGRCCRVACAVCRLSLTQRGRQFSMDAGTSPQQLSCRANCQGKHVSAQGLKEPNG